MSRFFEFVVNHWVLWSTLAVILLLILSHEMRERLSGIKRLSPQELTQMVNREDALLLDIRDAEAFAGGHIAGSKNIPLADLTEKMEDLKPHAAKPMIVVCEAGRSAVGAAAQLAKAGFTAHILKGGLTAWRQENLPLGQ